MRWAPARTMRSQGGASTPIPSPAALHPCPAVTTPVLGRSHSPSLGPGAFPSYVQAVVYPKIFFQYIYVDIPSDLGYFYIWDISTY